MDKANKMTNRYNNCNVSHEMDAFKAIACALTTAISPSNQRSIRKNILFMILSKVSRGITVHPILNNMLLPSI